jgi:hypothetical protein
LETQHGPERRTQCSSWQTHDPSTRCEKEIKLKPSREEERCTTRHGRGIKKKRMPVNEEYTGRVRQLAQVERERISELGVKWRSSGSINLTSDIEMKFVCFCFFFFF